MSLGHVIGIIRRARGLTQEALADRLGLKQSLQSRYENDLRLPPGGVLSDIASVLGVTTTLIRRAGTRTLHHGALATGAHFRHRHPVSMPVWRRLEAQLMLCGMHVDEVMREVDMTPAKSHLVVPRLDPAEHKPDAAAKIVRRQWRMPDGHIKNLVAWMEAAGCLIFESDFDTDRVDALSQWRGKHPVILLNISLLANQRRFALVRELAHLCLHHQDVTEDLESDTVAFAHEFLMPTAHIRRLLIPKMSTGRLRDIRQSWCIPMQELVARCYQMDDLISAKERASLNRQLKDLGWLPDGPLDDVLSVEHPSLLRAIGQGLLDQGLEGAKLAKATGIAQDNKNNPFLVSRRELRMLQSSI